MEYEFEGARPQLSPTSWVAPTAVLIGAVDLGAEASVWCGSVIRADGDRISIGERSNIQDGAVLHADPDRPVRLGSGVTVGHGAIVHGCTVQDDVIVGMRATILNHAVIGAGSIIGAGAVVSEGTTIPPGSLVLGVPGRVARQLDDDALARIRRNAASYVELARRYAHPDWDSPSEVADRRAP